MSMTNGIGAYGVQNGGNTPQLRPQFRRQGSSFGHGNVHNMAVMVVPTKVDYSVTKGGVRLWAVLFVFIVLCFAMLTVFTERDDDDDDHPITPTFDEDETKSEKNVKPSKIVEDEDLEDDGEDANPPDRGPITSPAVTAADDDDDGENEKPEEEELFAKLREKAAKQSARRKRKEAASKKAAEEDEENNGEDQQPAPAKQPRRRRKQKEAEVVEEGEKKVEAEPEVQEAHEEEEEPKQKKKSRRRKQGEVTEENHEDDEEPDIPTEIPYSHAHKNDQNDNDEEPSLQDYHDGDDKHDDENNDDDNDDDDFQPTAQPSHHKPGKSPKKKASSWHRNVKEENPLPRKNLLKHTKRKQKAYPPTNENNNGEDEDDDDDDNEEEKEENEDEAAMDTTPEQRMQINDIVSLRKKNPQYNRKAITNRDDYKHRNRLDTADFLLEKHEFAKASSLYDQVLASNKESPRAHYGKARTLQLRSEFEGNEHLLDAAIAEYQIVLDDDDTPEALFRMTADNIIECARYRGNLHKVMTVQRSLLDRFPDDIELQNNFGITFLMMGRIEDARNVFSVVLETAPNDPLAQAYYGYILKVHDNDIEKGVQFMRRGLRGSDEAIIDSRFYFHLGDGLMRLGRSQEATRVYEEATHLGLFPSPFQRSFHNLEGLIARPWWTLEQTGCGKHLKHVERQWTVIREEAMKLWQKYENLFEPEDSHLTEGVRVAFQFTRDSTFIEENCKKAPQTCAILKKFVNDAGCFKGDIRLSVLQSGSRIWPHCGATNYVLEAQLGLHVTSEARIRVANDIKGWKTGKFFVYDESFEHEVWFDGASANALRIILSLNLWHPEVPQLSRADTLRP